MKQWKVLPTDQRYLDLTDEQRELLWEDFLLDNPDIARKIEAQTQDPEFEKDWENLDNESPEEASEEDEWEDISDKLDEFIESKGLDLEVNPEVEEILKRAQAESVEKEKQKLADFDWEEVDE